MIKKLNEEILQDSAYPFTSSSLIEKINEIIDYINNQDIKPSKHKQRNGTINNIQEAMKRIKKGEFDTFGEVFAEKKVDKLEELNKYLNDPDKIICVYTSNRSYLRGIKKLIKQVIDQLIKENEELKNDFSWHLQQGNEATIRMNRSYEELEKQLQWIKNNICYCSEQNCVLDIANCCEECIKKNILKLKQKPKIDEDLIKWLKNVTCRFIGDFAKNDREYANKLLKSN